MTETFVTSGNIALWTTAHGSGMPIVVCNGGPGCCDYLVPVAAMFGDDYQVIRFEHRGCGRSAAVPPYSIATCLADLELVRQHYEIEQWIVCGHSFGADLALMYALHYPHHVRGVICLAGGRMNNDREWHNVYDQKCDQEPSLDYVYPPNQAVNAQVNADWKRCIQRPTLFRDLARLDIPVCFIYGANDIRPSWPVEQVAHLLPNASFTCLDEADHYLWLAQAAALQAHMQTFVQALSNR